VYRLLFDLHLKTSLRYSLLRQKNNLSSSQRKAVTLIIYIYKMADGLTTLLSPHQPSNIYSIIDLQKQVKEITVCWCVFVEQHIDNDNI